MANILIYTSGTLGDHLPFVALGKVLTARGHRVRMAINKAMHVYARRLGLEAIALTDIDRGPEQAQENAWAWDHWNNPDLAHHLKAKPFDVEGYIIQARELIDLCQDADLLISTSIRTLGYVAHSGTGLPWLTVSMNPYTFWQPVLVEEREAWERGRFEEYRNHKGLLASVFAELDIDKPPPSWSMGWLFARHIILASSSHFSLPDLNQLQPRSSIDMTGFWFYEDPDWQNWQPDENLLRFMERRPIVLSFSSQPLEDPGRILRLHVEASARMRKPLLVLKGWAGFTAKDLPPTANPQDILFADFIPHDWVFAKAECAIVHGGIGSIARALRQGCPLLIEPYGNDQIYNASCVASLGVGAAMHPFKMTAEGVVKVMSEKVLTPICRQRAQALGTKILIERGLETSCHLIENYLSWPRSNDEEKTWQVPSLTHRSLPQSSDMPGRGKDPAQDVQENHRKSIPKILHQTWRDKNLPPDFARFQHSWQIHHPGWKCYLWTDTDNREFLKAHYPWFLSIYDNYPEPIMRADAVRYFILHHYGGVYVDLDFECLRPLDPLLTNRELVLGLEPSKHLEMHFPQGRPFPQIVCNAFLASLPQHPFWEHVFKQLIAYHRAPGPLDATGPFLLTRAYESYGHKETITIEPSDIIYPISGEKPWDELPSEVRVGVTRTAYAIHHWRGTWWREAVAKRAKQVKVSLLVRGEAVNISVMSMDVSLALFRAARDRPLISCLMVTKNRLGLAKGAVHCFQQQTYPNKELVIVDDGEDDSLNQWIEELRDDRINYVRLPAENRRLGELRNIAVEKARGVYVAQWDDDDLSDQMRLEVQLATIHLLQTDACFLEREQIWWPKKRRLGLSTRRIWEGSFLCAKKKLPFYPPRRQGEDTPVIGKIVSDGRTALLDFPQLYVYIFHGENTFTAEHWEAHWLAATESYEGGMYDIMIRELQDRLGLDLSPWMSKEIISPPLDAHSRTVFEERKSTTEGKKESFGKILILTPVKDAMGFLERFWKNLRNLTYPHDKLSVAFLESDSIDGTYKFIEEKLPALRTEFAKVKLFKRDYGYRSGLPRWDPSEQFRRRSTMAKSRNYLLARALEDEDWVLWIDVDVARWPKDVIERLLSAQKEIIVPHCLSERTGETFDYNTFKLKPGAENLDWSSYIVDGIVQPPRGYGRFYLADLREHDCVEVDAVGGTMLLIQADLHREGLVFPSFSYRLHIETEGLAFLARDMGYRCWGLPNLEIFHP